MAAKKKFSTATSRNFHDFETLGLEMFCEAAIVILVVGKLPTEDPGRKFTAPAAPWRRARQITTLNLSACGSAYFLASVPGLLANAWGLLG
jgi:hypothetical protein